MQPTASRCPAPRRLPARCLVQFARGRRFRRYRSAWPTRLVALLSIGEEAARATNRPRGLRADAGLVGPAPVARVLAMPIAAHHGRVADVVVTDGSRPPCSDPRGRVKPSSTPAVGFDPTSQPRAAKDLMPALLPLYYTSTPPIRRAMLLGSTACASSATVRPGRPPCATPSGWRRRWSRRTWSDILAPRSLRLGKIAPVQLGHRPGPEKWRRCAGRDPRRAGTPRSGGDPRSRPRPAGRHPRDRTGGHQRG